MTTAVRPDRTPPAPPPDAPRDPMTGVDLSFLDATHPEWTARVAAWARDEARLAGGDHVLRELVPWKGEDGLSYAARWQQAKYLNFPQLHALIMSGHLERARPMPGRGFSLAPLGDIRERDTQDSVPTPAEQFWYGADGIGTSANPFPQVAAETQKRAAATGHRWTLVEMPSLAEIRRAQRRPWAPGAIADAEDRAHGFRPYLVEFSPRLVPYWEMRQGTLQCAIVRVPVQCGRVTDGAFQAGVGKLGYYVLVRRGCESFGPAFQAGGWWLFDDARTLVTEYGQAMRGTFDDCDGEIPLFPLVAATDEAAMDPPSSAAGLANGGVAVDAQTFYQMQTGVSYAMGPWTGATRAFDRASILPFSRSLTMELGQLAVNLMNRLSERDSNYSQACKSVLYITGLDPRDPAAFNLTVTKAADGSIIVPVPAWIDEQGTAHLPTIWSSSASLVDANAGTLIVQSTLAEAREIMVRQLTADAAQTGAAKRVEFASGASPLLAHLLLGRATWEGNVCYYVCRRAGVAHDAAWQAYSKWPREIELRPVVDDIDALLATLPLAQVTSATLVVDLVLQAATERGLIKPGKEAAIRAELLASITAQQPSALDRLLGGGGGGAGGASPLPTDPPPAPTVGEPPAPAPPPVRRLTINHGDGRPPTTIDAQS